MWAGDRLYELPKNDCPWDTLLEYRSPRLEDHYLQTQHKFWCIADFWFYTMMLLGSISWVLLQGSSTQPLLKNGDINLLVPLESSTLLTCWVALSILGTIMLVWLSKQHKGPYRSYEVIVLAPTVLLSVYRMCCCIMHGNYEIEVSTMSIMKIKEVNHAVLSCRQD